jgi:voltage-gated potassium channel
MKRIDGHKKRIVLFGYGKYGRMLYRILREAGYDITVAIWKEENFARAEADGVKDMRAFSPRSNESIRGLRIDPANTLLYCVMERTANNLFLVLSLRELYHDTPIIAISNTEENSRKLRYAGADTIIDIYEAASRYIVTDITRPAVSEAINEIVFRNNDLKIAEIELEEGTFLEGAMTGSIDFGRRGIVLLAIIDKELGDKLIFATKGLDHKLDAGDTIILAGKERDIEAFRAELVASNKTIPQGVHDES